MNARLRSIVVVVVGLIAMFVAADRLVNSPAFLKPRDFLEYWSAGAIALRGGNPYDPAELLREQQLVEPDRSDPVMMWNPPWALPLYVPLGALPVRWATLLWIALQLVAVIVSCELLWRTAGGTPQLRWTAQAVGLTFVGTWWTVSFGQNTGLLLLGLAGFAYFRKQNRPAIAGIFVALTALKPHLLAAFGVLFVMDAFFSRAGRISLLVGIGVLLAAFGIAMMLNPEVLSQYRAAVRDPGPDAIPLHGWVLPVGSYWLRMWIAPHEFWVQFVPCALACLGLIIYRLRCGDHWDWDWHLQLPLVVWLSVLCTPYGGWIFDLAVLLVPLIATAARVEHFGRRPVQLGLFAAHLAVLIITLVGVFDLHQFFWVAPAVLGIDLAARALLPANARLAP